MSRRIRHVALGLMVLYLVLFVQLNVIQLARSEELRADPANTREIVREFSEPRGSILTVDGEVLARSVSVEDELERLREYPDGELYGHITGFFSLNYGASGLERAFNAELAGTDNKVQLKTISDLFVDRDRTADVIITVRHELQRVARAALGDRRGAVVALDPRNGEILAMWSNPSFDPNRLSDHDLAAAAEARAELLADVDDPLRSRAYQERYPPGSTFKTVTAAAALESGVATPVEPVFPVTAEYLPPQTTRPITNFGGSSCGGDLTELLRVSCNTGFAALGVAVGPQVLSGTARDFGFNDELPLDLPGGVESVFPPADFFSDNLPLLAQSAIGQFEVAATPIQMALVAATIANDGVTMRPHIVSEVRDSDGALVSRTEPEVWATPISRDTAADLQQMLENVVVSGTARRLRIEGVRVAGKTGTAEFGSGENTHAWIVAFAPVEDPRVAVVVFVQGDEETGQQTGGTVAAPIARQVLITALDLVS
ncbi:MAG TPA: penicillin-binding protein 2 [Acidimicrobiales bacterium]|nr:penicillin-binding protein 2 [Acidimicrobiales bacterium]